MWYLAWVLGTWFAVAFAVIPALWYEMHEGDDVA